MNTDTEKGSEHEAAEKAALVLPPDAMLAGVADQLVDQTWTDRAL